MTLFRQEKFQLEQWHWWVLSLCFVVTMAMFRGAIHIWLTVATAVIGVLLWLDPQMPMKIQFLLLGAIVIIGMFISSYFPGKQKIQTEPQTDNPEFSDLLKDENMVGRVFTLEEPIINGLGTLSYNNQQWRLRGVDAVAGTKIRILSIDGIDQTLLQIEQVKANEQ